MRSSKQRDLILDIVNHSQSHNTTQEIYQKAREVMPKISLGTVYRNLNQLVDAKLLIRIKTDEGMDRFDNTLLGHHHFICDSCGRIIDVFQDFSLPMNVIPNSKITHYTIQFYGICDKCLEED